MSVRTVSLLLRVFNIGNAVLLAIACWYAYGIANSATRFFLATYIGLFALLLFLFESRVKWTEKAIRRLFGFMFTYSGRAIFLIFLGAICFGMLDSSQGEQTTQGYKWCLGVGVATLTNAIFNCFIICNHPAFQKMGNADGAGSDPSRMSDDEIRAYLEAHPELAQAAVAGFKEAHPQPVDHSAVVIGEADESGAGRGASAADAVPDWAASRSTGQAKTAASSGGGGGGGAGFSGMFGFGKKQAAGPDAGTGYQPPAVTASAPAAVPAPAPSSPALANASAAAAGPNPFDGTERASAPPVPPRRAQASSSSGGAGAVAVGAAVAVAVGAAVAVAVTSPKSAPKSAPSPVSAPAPAPVPAPAPAPAAVEEEDNPFATGGF